MKIRRLERSDYTNLIYLLEQFQASCGIKSIEQGTSNEEHVRQVLLRCEKGGLSYVGEVNGKIKGCILSIIVPDLWMPQTLFLREIAWFVDKDYRGTSMGARLFAAYKKEAELWQKSGRIRAFTMAKLHNSPNFDYEKRGFQYIESQYMSGE
jgi:N-acetylglutamate synthase-like GNAT family acetyltransferase